MYLASIILLLFILPTASVLGEGLWAAAQPDWLWLIGKWFTFWGVGARLFLAGVMQAFRPQFTAQSIFGIEDKRALGIVREIGFGNLAMGTLGLASLAKPEWVLPAAIVGGLYYGLAGLGHAGRPERNFKEQIALVSDLLIFLLLAIFVASRLL